MGKFTKNKKGKQDGRKPFKRYDKMERKEQKLHEATCESCGKTCGVPFKPNGKKPVYCSLCFKQGKGQDDRRTSAKKRDVHTVVFHTKDFDRLNKKLDEILALLRG